jgi:hypothetical protein
MEVNKSQFKVDSDDYLTNAAMGYNIEPEVGDVAYLEFTNNTNPMAKDKLAFASRYVITKIDAKKMHFKSLFDVYGPKPEEITGDSDSVEYTKLEKKKEIVISKDDIVKQYYHAHSNIWVIFAVEGSKTEVEVQKMEKVKIENPEKKSRPNSETFGKSDKKTEKMTKVKVAGKTGTGSKANIDTYFDSKGK